MYVVGLLIFDAFSTAIDHADIKVDEICQWSWNLNVYECIDIEGVNGMRTVFPLLIKIYK